jgi:hypothetical protein
MYWLYRAWAWNWNRWPLQSTFFQDQKRARSALELCSMADLGGSLGGPAGGHQSRSERSSRVRNTARVKRRASSPSNIVQVRKDQCCKDKSHKKVTKQEESRFFSLFLLDVRRIGIPDPYLWLMDPDPGGPKYTAPMDPDPLHCKRQWIMFMDLLQIQFSFLLVSVESTVIALGNMILNVQPESQILIFLPIPDPGPRGQKGTGSRIRIRNTAWKCQTGQYTNNKVFFKKFSRKGFFL